MRRMTQTLGGLWMLLRLAVRTRFRFRGPYWRWRLETAFGASESRRLPFLSRLGAILSYARWTWRMRRGS